jgi:hypothetical protein
MEISLSQETWTMMIAAHVQFFREAAPAELDLPTCIPARTDGTPMIRFYRVADIEIPLLSALWTKSLSTIL